MNHPDIETDLEKIETLGQLRKDENYRFRKFLKSQNGRKIDLLIHRLNAEVSAKVDCTACGNCCKHLSPCLNKSDLHNLSEALVLSPAEVVEKYTEPLGQDLSLKHMPCTFLKDNKCSIYKHRPETCASFPHLHKNDFISRTRQAIDSYSICPIMFNVIERMKTDLHFE